MVRVAELLGGLLFLSIGVWTLVDFERAFRSAAFVEGLTLRGDPEHNWLGRLRVVGGGVLFLLSGLFFVVDAVLLLIPS